jgi:ATP phosphoribosyltransferase regulatory subunit
MMQDIYGILRREEQITLYLRGLYERCGYRKYRMGKFEEYDLYLENKNFLKSPNVITFHDLDGRVLALKPDVTLSIAKHTHATGESREKFYYLENVYRLDKPSGGYREISQLGLECIGSLGVVALYEVLALAQKTLAAISESHRMQLSHMGFLVALFDGLGIAAADRASLLECIRGKNKHELKKRAQEAGITPAAAAMLMTAADLCGDFTATVKRARDIAITQNMTDALDQLEKVYELLAAAGQQEGIILDFSLVSDIDYYDGIVFQGYVQGVPRALLTGGCYGNLLKKFGRDLNAIGFAVYLNELNLLFRDRTKVDVDMLILYSDDSDAPALIRLADKLMDEGKRIRLEKSIPAELRYTALYRFENGTLTEVTENA